MNELALFAGAGGGILAGHSLGWRTVCAVERDAYAAQVLAQRQNSGALRPFPIWADVCSFDGRPWRGLVDVVSGGFPCQDISVAGRGAGIEGARSGMWGHMARIIGEVRPWLVYVENSPALLTRGLGRVLGDLAALGYDCRWTVLGAADVGAPTSATGSGLWVPTPCATDAKPITGGSLYVTETGTVRHMRPDGKSSNRGLAASAAMWPTPTSSLGTNGGRVTPAKAREGGTLIEALSARTFATPTARDWRSGKASQATHDRNSRPLSEQIGGLLNPTWVEWLMGWPIGWTDLKPLETDRCPGAQPQPGECSLVA